MDVIAIPSRRIRAPAQRGGEAAASVRLDVADPEAYGLTKSLAQQPTTRTGYYREKQETPSLRAGISSNLTSRQHFDVVSLC